MIADRHGQERISFRMLLPSEPLSCAMLSSSVCHENPLHVIMDVCMPTSTTAIPGPCHLSQVHATSRGKSITLHIACHFQRRLCPCDGFLVGIRPSDSSAEPVALKRCRIFLQFLEAAMHSSGLFRTRGASVEAFILRLSRIRDFVLKHRFLHLTRNSLWGKACVHERHSAPPVFSV